eukprot:m.118303 g.118303  ORF g.118303 m.118303 type:complete len:106 (-) comp15446_c0_seq7:133-450(-)
MNPQQSQLLASLAFLVADDKTASTFDQLAYWGSSKPQGTTAHTVSEQWLKARAFSSVASLLTQTQQAASTADVKRVSLCFSASLESNYLYTGDCCPDQCVLLSCV